LVDYILRPFLPTVHIDGGGAWVGFILVWIVYFDPTRECGGCAVGARDLVLVLVFVLVLVLVFESYNLSNISFLFLLNWTATFCTIGWTNGVIFRCPFLPTVHSYIGGRRPLRVTFLLMAFKNVTITRKAEIGDTSGFGPYNYFWVTNFSNFFMIC